jgi:hypothetical protein
MAYIGKGPEQVLSGVASKSTFTGDGSTTTFDISTDIPAGGENDIQVFVDNVRQEPGSGASYTVGVDGSGNLRRITFNTAPEASQSIYVINPRRLEAFGQVPDGAIATTKLQDTSVTTAKITDLNVTTGKIAADAITEAKIADNAISEEHLDTTVVTGLTELSEEANNNDTLLVYDTSAGALKKILRSNLVLQGPTVSSVSPTSVTSGDGTGNYTFTITGTGFTSASASLINNSGTTVDFDTVTVDSATQITGVIAKSSLPGSGEPYDVKVIGSNGLATTLENQINIDQSPTFNNAAGSIGSVADGSRDSTTLTIEAYDPESAGNVTFEIQSGSLPAGATATTVNENGVSKYQISGFSAVGGNTTSNFVIRAADANSNTSSRSFSITVLAPTSESFTSSGTFSVPSGVTAITALVVAGGGGGYWSTGNASYAGGGGGAGGLVFMPAYPVTPGGTITVTVGDGGGDAISSGNHGQQGQNSVLGSPGDPGLGQGGVLTAIGGGGGGSGDGPAATPAFTGPTGGSGGGGGAGPGPAPGASATQPTQPGNSGAYGFGNPGGSGSSATFTAGGGGGGAGGAGGNFSNNGDCGGQGGIGKTYTISDGTTPVYYAGGGGGGTGYKNGTGQTFSSPGVAGQGGQGGGGAGGETNISQSAAGQANKGGGGGSEGGGASSVNSNGGKGIVIVRY